MTTTTVFRKVLLILGCMILGGVAPVFLTYILYMLLGAIGWVVFGDPNYLVRGLPVVRYIDALLIVRVGVIIGAVFGVFIVTLPDNERGQEAKP